jgi:DNA-binding response OmpR family regulator
MLETILVIDDDSEICRSIALTLESKDYLVFSAEGENVGITLAKKTNPRLIFISPDIAGGHWLEICGKIREIDHLKNVPIVAVASPDTAIDPNDAALYGVVGTLQKPFEPRDVIEKTKEAISMKPEDMRPPVVAETSTGEEAYHEEASADESRERSSAREDHPDEQLNEEQITVEREVPAVAMKTAKRAKLGTGLPVPLIAVVVIIVLGAAGVIFYNKSPLFETRTRKQANPPEKVPQQTAQNNPLPEAQKPAESTFPAVPAPSPKSQAPVEAAAPEPGPKPSVQKAPSRPSTETEEVAGNFYSVQVGAFSKRSNASSLAKRLGKKGYKSFVKKTASGAKSPLYRVLVGKFKTRKEASLFAIKVSANEHIKTTVFKR